MKTQFKKHMLLCLSLTSSSFFFLACNPTDKPQQNNGIALNRTPVPEDVLDLAGHPKEPAIGEALIDKCKDSIRVDSSTYLNRVIEIIHKSALPSLKQKASDLRTSDTDNSVLAVRIIYGLNASKQMKLYYQPLFLKRTTGNAIKAGAEYDPTATPDYYKYVSSPPSFSVVSSATVAAAVSNYTNHITFRNSNNAHFRKFLNTANTDSTGDVKAVVYSFQEIDSLINGNPTDVVYILNSAENIRANHKTYMRHSLLLGPDEKVQPIYMFYMMYGNLSHLCPPSCNKHFFNRK
jgi:hypothetical protein